MTTTHVMLDPANVVSFPAPDRTATPKAESSLPTGAAIAFTSLAQLDAALLAEGDSQAYLNTLTINDKVFRLRGMIAAGDITPADFLPTATIEASTDPTDEVLPYGTVWINEATPEAFQTAGDGNWTSIWDGSA